MSELRSVPVGDDLESWQADRARREVHEVFLVVGSMIVFGFSGFRIGTEEGVTQERAAAVKAGAGRWEVNIKTGEKTFRYGVVSREGRGVPAP